MISFQEGIKTIIKPSISENGQMYLPWATAIALARRPNQPGVAVVRRRVGRRRV